MIRAHMIHVDGADSSPQYVQRLTLARRASRPVREAVEVELRGRAASQRAHLVWDDARERATFVVDPKGVIRKVYEKVNPEGHERVLLNDIQGLKAA